MPTTEILIADASPTERKLTKGLLDMILRREGRAQRLANYQKQVTDDTASLAKIDDDLLPALEAAFSTRGFASIDGIELLRDEATGKPNGVKLTHP